MASYNHKDSIPTDRVNQTISNNIPPKLKRPWFEHPWIIALGCGLIILIVKVTFFDKNDEKSTNVSSFNQQSGITANKVNIGKQERHFSEATKASLTPNLPKDKERPIGLEVALGDGEATQFAEEIKQFLEGEGYNVRSFDLVIWNPPVIGVQIIPSKDGGIKIRIGRHK